MKTTFQNGDSDTYVESELFINPFHIPKIKFWTYLSQPI